jgi:hypothetical protein
VVLELDRLLERRFERRVLLGFDLPRFVRDVERDLLVRREDDAVLFFATNNPSQALSQIHVQNLCHLSTIPSPL